MQTLSTISEKKVMSEEQKTLPEQKSNQKNLVISLFISILMQKCHLSLFWDKFWKTVMKSIKKNNWWMIWSLGKKKTLIKKKTNKREEKIAKANKKMQQWQ